jgi:integrase
MSTDDLITLELVLNDWIDRRVSLRDSTRISYQGHIRNHLIPVLGSTPLHMLTTRVIEDAYRMLMADANLSAATLERVHATLHACLEWAITHKLMDHNPASRAELPRTASVKPDGWSVEQARTFLTYVQGDPLEALWRLLLVHGLRRGEALGLRWFDLDYNAATLHIRRQLTLVSGKPRWEEPKTANGIRDIQLDTRTLLALRGIKEMQQRWSDITSQSAGDPVLLFTTIKGEPLNPATVLRWFHKLCAEANLPHIRIHDLRHASAAIGLAAGEGITEISRRLGHSSITTTANLYTTVPAALAAAHATARAELLTTPLTQGATQ